MKVVNFQELLIRKAEGNQVLQTLVKFMDKTVLAEKVLESLEKMARASHKGDTANLALRDFAQDMDPELEPKMIHDALGHHVSHYKAALKAGRNDLANAHAKQAFNIMNMADRAQKHSQGKLSLEHVSPHAWERNKVTSTYETTHPKVQEGKYKAGEFKTKTKGLNYKGNDFSFLQEAPHSSFAKEIKRHGHNKAYPFEHTRVNGQYINVEDVDPSELKGYEAHPFDKHPVMSHYSEPAKNRTPESDQQYFNEKNQYYNESPHIEKFFNQQEQKEAANPEAHAKIGSAPSAPVHEDIEGLNLDNIPATSEPTPIKEKPKAAPLKDIHPDVLDKIKQLNPELLARLGLEDKKK